MIIKVALDMGKKPGEIAATWTARELREMRHYYNITAEEEAEAVRNAKNQAKRR